MNFREANLLNVAKEKEEHDSVDPVDPVDPHLNMLNMFWDDSYLLCSGELYAVCILEHR